METMLKFKRLSDLTGLFTLCSGFSEGKRRVGEHGDHAQVQASVRSLQRSLGHPRSSQEVKDRYLKIGSALWAFLGIRDIWCRSGSADPYF
jgi:hypothetical protein